MNKGFKIQCYFTQSQENFLRSESESNNIPMAEVVRSAIDYYKDKIISKRYKMDEAEKLKKIDKLKNEIAELEGKKVDKPNLDLVIQNLEAKKKKLQEGNNNNGRIWLND